jgi:hypothetical protein
VEQAVAASELDDVIAAATAAVARVVETAAALSKEKTVVRVAGVAARALAKAAALAKTVTPAAKKPKAQRAQMVETGTESDDSDDAASLSDSDSCTTVGSDCDMSIEGGIDNGSDSDVVPTMHQVKRKPEQRPVAKRRWIRS